MTYRGTARRGDGTHEPPRKASDSCLGCAPRYCAERSDNNKSAPGHRIIIHRAAYHEPQVTIDKRVNIVGDNAPVVDGDSQDGLILVTRPTARRLPTRQARPASSSQIVGGPFTPDPAGKVITVELYGDGNGKYFKPAEIHARRGDVIRYTLKVGVHNVHFLPDSNAGRHGYPTSASDFLQVPGQTCDVLVLPCARTYYFQCDPQSALGMKGHLIVE